MSNTSALTVTFHEEVRFKLGELALKQKRSEAAIVRDAVDQYLTSRGMGVSGVVIERDRFNAS